MPNRPSLTPQDSVLEFNSETEKIDLSKYEDFLYEFCGDWDFQKEAVRKAVKFYLSEYQDTKELFEENYEEKTVLQEYQKKDLLLKEIPFPYKKACTIDLATGTGKSWVMYAVARILLAKGIVDRVLVLCPSTTIKRELYNKFFEFTQNEIYTNALPEDAKYKIPGIKHSDSTIEEGDICIDNVHKTYDHVSSSINDSLERKGAKTLVINDEAHHILNPKGAERQADTMLEWFNFLNDERYSFKYILNLSGTPYKGDTYFFDVIYRFSIRDAINKRFVKDIDYLDKDTSQSELERWKAIFGNHEEMKRIYPLAKKHMTIVVTKSISDCDKVAQDIKDFLIENTDMDNETADKKVIAVSSSPRHDDSREILKTVDDDSNPVEWIVSVSMLTEGWDVKNVFQIVPHEARAFNSKLLISQVLGRGLRIPEEYRGSEILPKVRIFNHQAWSINIDNLVMEVAEITNNLTSYIIKDSEFNFDLHKINIDKQIVGEKKTSEVKELTLPKKLGFHTTNQTREQEYTNIQTHRKYVKTTTVGSKFYTVEQATNDIFTNIYYFDMKNNTNITSKLSKDYIRDLIKKELKAIGEKEVSDENLQLAKLAFNVVFRQFIGVTKISEIYSNIETINTSEMKPIRMSEASFKKNGGLVIPKQNLSTITEDDIEIITKVKEENDATLQTTLTDQTYFRARILDHIDINEYRSPWNMTLVSFDPERRFCEQLVQKYSRYIDSWVKSPDVGFYEIPYIHRPGTHSLQKDFNPDFLIKKGNKIIVVETKMPRR